MKNKDSTIDLSLLQHNREACANIVQLLMKKPVVEVAEWMMQLESVPMLDLLTRFTPEKQGFIMAEFPLKLQLDIFQSLSKRRFAEIFEQMPSDAQVDIFQHMTQSEQAELLPFLKKVVKEQVISLSAYPPETAGGIMSTDFATVKENMTCAEAIAKVRADAPSKKTIYYVYVVDDDQKLIGFITLKNLILNHPQTLVSDSMHRDFVFARVDEDREKVAEKIEKYDLVTIPILNHAGQLVGIVTHDEAIDIIRAEHTEDMEKFMGIVKANKESNYVETNVWKHFTRRVVWIVSLAAVGLVSGIIIHSYENTLSKLMILALYMPMVADTGGNCGSQAATVVVRALALNQISFRKWWQVIWKEARISLLLSVCLGVIAFVKVMFLSWETEIPQAHSLSKIALVISIALALQTITATIIGAALPLFVKRFGGDPAVAASPAITTVVDITGLIIYFSLATLFFTF
ncbi:MAG: magnesium transporter [Flavobacteriales bacterium]